MGTTARIDPLREPGRFRLLLEALPQLVWTATPDGHLDYLSPSWCTYTGLPVEGLLGLAWQEVVHPDDRARLDSAWSQHPSAGDLFEITLRLRDQAGQHRWFDVRAAYDAAPGTADAARAGRWSGACTEPVRTPDPGGPDGSRGHLQAVFEHMSEGLVTCDDRGHVLSCNRAGVELHGFATVEEALAGLEDLEGHFELMGPHGDLVAPDDWPLRRVLRGDVVHDEPLRLRRRGSSWERVLSYRGARLPAGTGPAGAFVAITDHTARHDALDALAGSEERLRLASDATGVGTYDIDFALGHIRYSPEMCNLLGLDGAAEHPLDESLGFVHPDDAEDFERSFAEARDPSGPGTSHGEHRFVHSSGEVRWAAWSARTSFGSTPEGRRPVRTLGAYVDVTEPRQAQRRLATQNAASRSLLDAVVTGEALPQIIRSMCESEGWDMGTYWALDHTGERLRCADHWHREEALLEPFVAITRTLTFARGEGLPGRVWASAAPLMIADVGQDPAYVSADVAHAAGLHSAVAMPILVRGEVVGVLDFVGRALEGGDDEPLEMLAAVGRQLGLAFGRKQAEEDRHQLEAQLRQKQRIEAIGALSGGIAHDFNNILAAISGNVELATDDLTDDHPARAALDAIAHASQHARNLVQQILTFAQQRPVERHAVALGPLAEEGARLLAASLPPGVDLRVHVEPGCPWVLADATQLAQIVVNLGTNAWHALDGRTGTVEITVGPVVVDEARARLLPGLAAGPGALLTVRDTGSGMEPAVLERIFDPFFTTKPHGGGTGLGLSVVHGIVQGHDGAIRVTSVPGGGTTFEVHLPAVAPPPDVPETTAATTPSGPLGQGEHILFVDDQAALVELARRALPRLGYEATGTTDPREAVALFAAAPEAYAVVVTDMNMPHLSGLDVARAVIDLRADVPVVLVSGYVAPDLVARAEAAGVREVVGKPVDLDLLAEVLHRALRPAAPLVTAADALAALDADADVDYQA